MDARSYGPQILPSVAEVRKRWAARIDQSPAHPSPVRERPGEEERKDHDARNGARKERDALEPGARKERDAREPGARTRNA